MGRASGGGDEYHQLDRAQCFLLDVMTTQMQCLPNHNNEELYGLMEGLENQLIQNAGQPNGGNKGGNDGPRQNRIKGKQRIE